MAYIRPFRGKWRAEVQKSGMRVSKVADSEAEARLWAEHVETEIAAKHKRFKPRELLVKQGADLVTMVPKIILEAARLVPHSAVDVIEASIPTGRASGVYFLIRDGDVVYVGQSLDVLGRISRHRREGKVFDAFSYMECDPDQLDRLEMLYIKALVPEENWTLGNPAARTRRRDVYTPEPRSIAIGDSEALT